MKRCSILRWRYWRSLTRRGRTIGSLLTLCAKCGRHSVRRSSLTNSLSCFKAYDVTKVIGDHYGGEFVKEPFRKHGISYELCKQPKSDLYRDLLPSLNSGQIVLPRHDRLVA